MNQKTVDTNRSSQSKNVVKVLDALKAHLTSDLVHYESISVTYHNIVDRRMKRNGFQNYSIKFVDIENQGIIAGIHLYSHTIPNLKKILPKNFKYSMTSASIHVYRGIPELHLEISFNTPT